jgi:beta-lactam-binding protein with PASTA domain
MACDPNFGSVSLLLHCDGANGSTSFPDSSGNGNVVTATTPAQVSTANPQFGTGALALGATGGTGNISCPTSGSGGLFDMGSGDFTYEFGIFVPSTPSANAYIMGDGFPNGGTGQIGLTYDFASRTIIGGVNFGGSTVTSATSPALSLNAWHSIAFVKHGTTLTVYCDGVGGTPITVAVGALNAPGVSFIAGFKPSFGGHIPNEMLDEIRITKGIARYTSNYTPAGPFGGTCAVTVPNVVGEVLATAEANIVAALLTVGTVTTANDPVVPAGDVVSQSPVGGASAMQTDPVSLVESLGPVMFTVPNVVGDLDALAQSTLLAASFTIGAITFAGDASPAGTVLSQNPAAGTSQIGATPVDLVESLGFTVGNVPNVVGLSLADASAALTAAALTTGALTFNFSATVPAGDVISQFPLAGSAVSVGSAVALQISRGITPLTVPDLTGLTAAEADAALAAVGLVTGGVTFANYALIPAGEVFRQNPAPFTVVGAGSLVSYVVSLGIAVPSSTFDFEQTVISQFANSPTLLQLVANMGQYLDMRSNFVEFFDFVWNVNTAQGFGLDIWGSIVGVSRLLQIPGSIEFFGFENSTMPVGVLPFNSGVFNSKGSYATDSFLLPDDAYRTLILVKALSNISATTAPSINQLLRNLFPGRGNAYVLDLGGMAMQFHFAFTLTVTELAILGQSGALPHPAGVSVTITSI